MAWKSIADTAELVARRHSPIKVLIACWYDGGRLVTEAEYRGDGDFGRWGGGPLSADMVPTHWDWHPPPPSEAEMLAVSLRDVIRA